MPASPRWCWLSDGLVPWRDAVLPVEDRGLQFGESLYEVVPVTAGAPRLLAAHSGRLARGAAELDLAAAVPDAATWDRVAAALVAAEEVTEGLLYAQVTGGVAPREYLPEARSAPTFLAYLRRHRFPRQAEVMQGVRAVTIADERWGRCDLKTTMLLPAVRAKRCARARGADEAILVGADGAVREGASTSLIAVLDGRLISPRPSPHLLSGTMSALVAELAAADGLEVEFEPVTLDRLTTATEVLLSATSKLVLPVLAIDDRPIGDGTAGPIAIRLAAAVRSRFELTDD